MGLQGLDIHWHDGLFVLQHHLQSMQRSVRAGDAAARAMRFAHPWGVAKFELRADALQEGLVAFQNLTAWMPSGLLVQAPTGADLEPLRVADVLRTSQAGQRVLLAVPNWTPTGPNVSGGDQADDSSRWNVGTVEVRDETDGTDPEQVPVRRVNARLVLESDVPAGMEVIPLLRVLPAGHGDQFSVTVDESYAPPCVTCSGNSQIMGVAAELAARLGSAREEHLAFLTRGGYDAERLTGQHVEWMMRLQAISSTLPALSDTTWLSSLSPFELYHLLRGLLGQLSPLRPSRDLYDVPPYDHADALPTLSELALRIRNLVFDAGTGSYLSVPFEAVQTEGSDIRMDATLQDKHFVEAEDFFLAVDAGEGHTDDAVALVLDADRFKLLPSSRASGRVRGITLSEERFPPLALPARPGRVYFKIDRGASAAAWAQVREDGKVSAVWSSNVTIGGLELVMNTSGGGDG